MVRHHRLAFEILNSEIPNPRFLCASVSLW